MMEKEIVYKEKYSDISFLDNDNLKESLTMNDDALVGFSLQDACLYLFNGEFSGMIPDSVTVVLTDIDENGEVLYDPIEKTFLVKRLHLECKAWNIDIPSDVENVEIVRDYKNGSLDANSNNSTIYVDAENKHFTSTEDGSLYSKDMTVLYHLHCSNICQNIYLPITLSQIAPKAIYAERINTLVIPSGVTNILPSSIGGTITELDFSGEIESIDDKAFDLLNKKEVKAFKINTTISNLKHNTIIWDGLTRNNIKFACPKTDGGRVNSSGMIELSEVLNSEDKIQRNQDTTSVLLNPEIDKVLEDVASPLTIKSLHIDSTYNPAEGSELLVAYRNADRYVVKVHETTNQIDSLITKAKKTYLDELRSKLIKQ